MAVAVLCGLAGVAFGLLKPQDSTAVALVLLPPSAASTSGTPANDTHTDAVIADSTPVLTAAGAKVSPPVGVAKLRTLVTVRAVSGQILQVQARAPQAGYAEQLANAVASSYVTYTGQLAATSARPQVAALQQQSAQLTKQVNDLQTQIGTVSARIVAEASGSSAGLQDANLLSSLQSEQSQLSQELNSVTSQISAAQLAVSSTANITRILQTAAAVPADKYGLTVTAGIVGFTVGCLGSAVFVLVRAQRDRRLRLRDEIAQAAGAPVIVSIEAPSCTTPTAWRELLESRPRATAEWALRNLLHTLVKDGDQRRAVRVISFAGDVPALSTGPRLAVHAAASGTPTALMPEDPRAPDDRSLVMLRAAFTGAEPVGRGLPFTVGPNVKGSDAPQLLVSMVVFDGESATLTPSNTVNLLSISPDCVTADQVAQLALEAADGGSALGGVVMVNPDPSDTTSGLIATDALRLVPTDAPRNGAVNEPVQLEALTTTNGSLERLSSRERR
jgi:capsular polysaccharide biosynthesis protein